MHVKRAVQIRVFNESSGASRLIWVDVEDLIGDIPDLGEIARIAGVYDQPDEPAQAQPGDFWITEG